MAEAKLERVAASKFGVGVCFQGVAVPHPRTLWVATLKVGSGVGEVSREGGGEEEGWRVTDV